jgi:hypothetical protein
MLHKNMENIKRHITVLKRKTVMCAKKTLAGINCRLTVEESIFKTVPI